MGEKFHEKYLQEAEENKTRSVDEIKEAIFVWALIEKEEAVKQAILQANQEAENHLKEITEQHSNELKVELKKIETKMKQHLLEELKREREAANERLSHEIDRTLRKCAREKERAVDQARLEEMNIATRHLDKEMKRLQQKYETKMQLELAEALENQNKEFMEKIATEITVARSEEKKLAEEPIKELQVRHKSEIDQLKRIMCDKDANLQEVFEQVETMTVLEMDLESELRKTREAFQDYINLTFPKLAPGQADFILPSRPMCRDSTITFCSCKPPRKQE
eukprot:gi/632973693/ref/XP_007903277.1/ PREDICTED: uncharacterized protein C6orf163 homolog [Callorhinchus milii]